MAESGSSNSQLFELKLRRRLLSQQLTCLDSRCERIGVVLAKKRSGKGVVGEAKPGDAEQQDEGRRKSNAADNGGKDKHLQAPLSIKPSCLIRQLGEAAPAPREMIERRRQHTINKLRRRTEAEAQRRKAEADAQPRHLRREPNVPHSFFPSRYERGELPCCIIFRSTGKALSWMCPLDVLDFEYYLPIFIDGIRVEEDPCSFIAVQGCKELIEATRGHTDRVLACLTEIVRGLRYAMAVGKDSILRAAIRILTQLIEVHPDIGTAIVRFYKVFLPLLARHLERYRNMGDSMDYKRDDIGQLVGQLLELLESTGGKSAWSLIKRSVPSYEHYG